LFLNFGIFLNSKVSKDGEIFFSKILSVATSEHFYKLN
jgi:hypothetical protein